jgi:hypothetical protein
MQSGLGLFLALFLGAFAVWQAPHTVHHFFDSETEDQRECAFAASADRGEATETAGIVVAELPRPCGTAMPSVGAIAQSLAPPERDARAPPESSAAPRST